jgi:hypothetical protein
MLTQQQQKAPKAKQSKKAAKAEPEAEGAEPTKRPPSAWILFSVRVQKILRPAEEGKDKAERTPVGTMNQFAGTLWSQVKEGKEWSDEEIMAEWDSFEAPAVSKQAAAGKGKKSPAPSVGDGESGEPAADAAAVEKVKKARKPQSEETKKAAAAKRAATKAKKAAEAAGDDEDLGEVEEAADAEADIQPAAPVAAPPAPKPAPKKAAFVPKPKKAVDLALDAWEFEGNSDYLKNERGDVLSATTGEWVGHWDGAKLDTSAPEPADFETLAIRE